MAEPFRVQSVTTKYTHGLLDRDFDNLVHEAIIGNTTENSVYYIGCRGRSTKAVWTEVPQVPTCMRCIAAKLIGPRRHY